MDARTLRRAGGLILLAVAAFGLWTNLNQAPKPTQVSTVNAPDAQRPPETQNVPKRVKADPQFGYTPRPQETKQFVRSLAKPYLAQAGPELLAVKDRKPVVLYPFLQKAYAAHNGGKKWVVGAQGIGDCVSWGWGHAADIHLAVLWSHGESAEWKSAATEAIYGGSRVEAQGVSRGGWSDGSYGAAAAKWVRDWGVIFRQPYPEVLDARGSPLDLTIYSSSRAKDWGNYGCGGANDSGRLDGVAKSHPIRSVVVVRSFDEAAAAIASGYPVAVCSGQGFSSERDKDGFSAARGSWSHCMCFIGVRYEPRPGLLCLNSWGPSWVSGPKWPEDQPDGSFWVDARVATSMLDDGDSFAVSGYEGFPYRKLKHDAWVIFEQERGLQPKSLLVDQPRQRYDSVQTSADQWLGISL